MKKALIFHGGNPFHNQALMAARCRRLLEADGYSVELSKTLDCLADLTELLKYDLMIPCWSDTNHDFKYLRNVANAVGAGVGFAGCHAGMCATFDTCYEWHFLVGGKVTNHPGELGVNYTVNISSKSNPIVADLDDFSVTSEQYYMMVDPAVEVLATTRFPLAPYWHISNKPCDMPVVWTKMWGNGRVFYSSLGHDDELFEKSPNAEIIMKRGMVWAGEGREYAMKNGLTTERFRPKH